MLFFLFFTVSQVSIRTKRILQRAVTLGVFVPLSSPSALVWTLVFITAFCFCLCGKSVFTDDNPHYDSLSSMHVWVDTLTRFQGCTPGLPKLSLCVGVSALLPSPHLSRPIMAQMQGPLLLHPDAAHTSRAGG